MDRLWRWIGAGVLMVSLVVACGGPAVSVVTSDDETGGDQTGPEPSGGDESTPTCGDGVAAGHEDCDGADLAGASCASLPGFGGGTLACSSTCSLDVSGCTPSSCGDDRIDDGESCDGSALGGQTCVSLGFDDGVLSCTDDCRFDESGCVIWSCGNGVIEGQEECEGFDLGGRSCESEGFSGGQLVCTPHCLIDDSGCWPCGDGTIQGAEECDRGDLGGQTCFSLGYGFGTLGCTAACSFDTSGCAPPPNDCCAQNPTPGCTDAICEAAVCGSLPQCCNEPWNAACVQEAFEVCACGGGGVGDCCVDNGSPGCEVAACAAAVCTQDSFCCTVAWDTLFANIASQSCPHCPDTNAGSCCAANGSPGCVDAPCEASICASNPSCCATEWDAGCAAAAVASCPSCGMGSNCCVAHGSPGCDDMSCAVMICGQDSFCCDAVWDSLCASAANQHCAVCSDP